MIAISNRQRAKKINVRLLKSIATAALEALEIQATGLGIILLDAKEMAVMNEEFLSHEGATDVITFDYTSPAGDSGQWTVDSGQKKSLHGEIFICVEEAVRQAKEFKTTWQSELARYVIHGILHLTGHDDLNAAARKKMKLAEGRLLRELSRRFALSKL